MEESELSEEEFLYHGAVTLKYCLPLYLVSEMQKFYGNRATVCDFREIYSNNELTVVDTIPRVSMEMEEAIKVIEKNYFKLLDRENPDKVRGLLPCAVKSELYVTETPVQFIQILNEYYGKCKDDFSLDYICIFGWRELKNSVPGLDK